MLGINGTTLQNDLDVGFTISANADAEFQQEFVILGKKEWGSIKFGKDSGVFASDVMANDMRVDTTLGLGYTYADFKNQVAYLMLMASKQL